MPHVESGFLQDFHGRRGHEARAPGFADGSQIDPEVLHVVYDVVVRGFVAIPPDVVDFDRIPIHVVRLPVVGDEQPQRFKGDGVGLLRLRDDFAEDADPDALHPIHRRLFDEVHGDLIRVSIDDVELFHLFLVGDFPVAEPEVAALRFDADLGPGDVGPCHAFLNLGLFAFHVFCVFHNTFPFIFNEIIRFFG